LARNFIKKVKTENMKRILLFLALSLAAYVSFSQSPIYGRLRVVSGTYDNYFQNGTDTFKMGWRVDKFQLRYSGNKRFMDFVKADSSTMIYNKLILSSPNDTMLSVRGMFNATYDSYINSLRIGKGNSNILTNTALGNTALNAITTGNENTAIGYRAMQATTTGDGNTIVGAYSFIVNTTGRLNTAIGTATLNSNITGNNNIAIGRTALYKNSSGSSNIAIGVNSLNLNVVGNSNTAVGDFALYKVTGSYNVAMGGGALQNMTTGSDNVGIGTNAGNGMTANTNGNTLLGVNAGRSLTSPTTNNIFIGLSAGYHASQKVDAVNTMAIGESAYTTADNQYVYGNTSVTEHNFRSGKVIMTYAADTTLSVHGVSRFNNNIFIEDSIVFNDGTKQNTAWIPNVSDTGYVKTTGDSLYDNYRIFGSLRVGDAMTLGPVDSNFCIVHGLNSYSLAKWGAAFNNSDNNAEYGFSANGGHQFGFRGAALNDGQNNQEDGFVCNIAENFNSSMQNSFACNDAVNYTSFGFAAGSSFCNSWNSATFGYYNDTLPASKVSWVTTDPLFQIGNGTGWGTQNDAFRVLKNGKTYIGDSSGTTDAILIVDPTDSTSTFIGNFSGGGVNTVSGNSFAYGDSCIVTGESNFVSGKSNIIGAKAFLINTVTNSPAEIILESSEGDVTSNFTSGITIYAENYNDGSNFMIATINTSSFNGTNTVLTINEDITNIYDNWNYYIVVFDSMTSGSGNHIEGIQNRIYNGSYGCHVEGAYNTANGLYSHSEGSLTTASGNYSHAEGYNTTASGEDSHAEGGSTTASGAYSHAEGGSTTASGNYSHAEGSSTTAAGTDSHAEGSSTTAAGTDSHAEGYNTTASGEYSHAEGYNTTASGWAAIAGGWESRATSYYSQALGFDVKADAVSSFVCGAYNDTLQYEHNTDWYSYDPLFQIGNGLADTTRNDAFRVLKNGKTYIGDSSSTTDAILIVDPTDSTSTFIGKVIMQTPADTMLSVRGTSRFNGDMFPQQNISLLNTTNATKYGVIYKDAATFIHNFNYGNNGAVTTDGYNTFLGENAGNLTMGTTATASNQSSFNTGIGHSVLLNNTTGYYNTATGVTALTANTEGYYNTANGVQSLTSNTIGYQNTANGMFSMNDNISGHSNTASGMSALYKNTTGFTNTAQGFQAGMYITDGATANTTSDYCLFLGAGTRALADNDQNETVIGYNAIGLGSNSVNIGNTAITLTQLNGKVVLPYTADTTLSVRGNAYIADTTFMEHLTVTDSVSLEDALFDIYHLAPDADSLVVADDGIINLRAGAYGELRVFVYNSGVYDQFATVITNADGSIGLLVQNSANVTTTGGTDGNLNIYDGGAYTTIENKLGGSRTVKYVYTH